MQIRIWVDFRTMIISSIMNLQKNNELTKQFFGAF